MKIIQVHNSYQIRAGEDIAVESERLLLQSKGETIIPYHEDNSEIASYSHVENAKLFFRTSWSQKSFQRMKRAIQQERPDIIHVHNTFPLISPSVLYAAKQASLPVVQTLHNFRIFCPKATFFREGKVCNACLHDSLWNSVRYSCYRDSKLQSYTVAQMLWVHRALNTWDKNIDTFIALSRFSKEKFVEGGIQESRIVVKPNFIHVDVAPDYRHSSYAVSVGRLSPEKGVDVLLKAWKGQTLPLKIIGDGQLRSVLETKTRESELVNVEFMGGIPHADVISQIQRSSFLVFSSLCYENFPLAIVEAFACGKPVIASRLGAMAEIVSDGVTGLLFEPGNEVELADKVRWALEHPDHMRQMGINARKAFEENYTPERNYEMLISIYRRAIENNKKRRCDRTTS